ncbi:sodium:solute symporter family transporter [Fulvivirga sedimenti]|uniref:Sodium:solute symporter n=1 Tax=Fulvivirga sedimenti TaxID=2879465 RepID=A0A9X1HR93_9BACT|nr:sodium:solute symporter [Fulvivirga sedimenti]MCA6074583.1 sodium:solute symporter [Fulvivirga sedimenti]MCA6075760.1 sodium:solute symporter [Fulvivirga sedimenti]MCA6076888.1 sodium:solute symporter [Fulvivirga sedimenti]
MSNLDWLVLFGTLISIVVYGVYASRGSKNIEGFLLGDKSMRWWTIGLSIMATQASAITFLSTPGQAYDDGLRFIQFYFGLPIAMVILSVTFIPIYYRLKVYTAYEFLENRFDLKTRTLASFLFLVQRGLGAGITIFAPSIILSSILEVSLTFTTLIIGVLVIIYTVSGGTKAVSVTQKQQMGVMMGGMILAGIMVVKMLPDGVDFGDAITVAGKMGKLEAVDLEFDPTNRYNIWSGIIGGLFVALAYFGTDQSQVQRYLSGRSIRESRLGLIFNGLLKVPMQFIILFIGTMVFVFYQFYQPPVFFNDAAIEVVKNSEYREQFEEVEAAHQDLFAQKRQAIEGLIQAENANKADESEAYRTQIENYLDQDEEIRNKAKEIIVKADPKAETNDTDYVFISFVMNNLPHGLIGILLAVIFSAAMSSTASELNALASTTTVDIYKRSVKPAQSEQHYLNASRLFTLMWGLIAIMFATFASLLENLIELVNIVGSIFYGSILGIFLAAFYIKYIRGNAIFIAAVISQSMVIFLFMTTPIGYLWYNVIGCGMVVILGFIIQKIINSN